MGAGVEALNEQPCLARIGTDRLDDPAQARDLRFQPFQFLALVVVPAVLALVVVELDADETFALPADDSVIAAPVLRNEEREFGRQHRAARDLDPGPGLRQVADGAFDGRGSAVELGPSQEERPEPRCRAIWRSVSQ